MKDSDKIFQELKNDVVNYVELRTELFKVQAYERASRVTAVLSYGLILVFLAFFAVLFIFLALGFYLSELLESFGAGFGVVAILYLLLIGVILKCKEAISERVQNEVIAALTGSDDKKNESENEQPTTNPAGKTES